MGNNIYVIPLTNAPNHRFTCLVPVDNKNMYMDFFLHWNSVAEYWCMDISDSNGNPLMSSIPLIRGEYPAANLLEQYSYLGIGSSAVVPVGIVKGEADSENLGKDFVLVWSDTL